MYDMPHCVEGVCFFRIKFRSFNFRLLRVECALYIYIHILGLTVPMYALTVCSSWKSTGGKNQVSICYATIGLPLNHNL